MKVRHWDLLTELIWGGDHGDMNPPTRQQKMERPACLLACTVYFMITIWSNSFQINWEYAINENLNFSANLTNAKLL